VNKTRLILVLNPWLKNRIKGLKINPDGTVDAESVNFENLDLTKLPLQFRKVAENFYCFCNNLSSLEGAPKEVGRGFDCSNNKLTSLEGAPQEVGGIFYCSNNKLTSLEGAPQKVGGSFYCSNNPLPESEIERVKKIYKNVIESVRRIKFKVIE
jgi:hypothetical protein